MGLAVDSVEPNNLYKLHEGFWQGMPENLMSGRA